MWYNDPAQLNQHIARAAQYRGGESLETKKETRKEKRLQYSKPEVKKHENLKDITLLSFNPPN
jgi:hypothetical protein